MLAGYVRWVRARHIGSHPPSPQAHLSHHDHPRSRLRHPRAHPQGGLFHFARRTPRANDVVIDILYCGVCPTDIHHLRND